MKEAELYMSLTKGGNSHTQSILYSGGPALTNSSGVPWTAAYIDSRGDPTCDLRSNIAAESRAKIVYERLINLTDDPGIQDALGFLMTREIAHQKSFEKALYAIANNFPPGKLPGLRSFVNTYVNTSQGGAEANGPGTAASNGIGWTKRKQHCRRTAAMARLPFSWIRLRTWTKPKLRRENGRQRKSYLRQS